MKKKLLISVLSLGLLFTITGCGSKSSESSFKKPDKGNCTSLECILDLKTDSTVEEINKVVGFEGVLEDETNEKYVWEIGKDDSLSATYYSGKNATIEANFDRNDLKDDKIDFSKYDEIQTALKESSLTYDELSDKVNGKGYLYSISAYTKKYIWVNKDGEYLSATFSTTNDKCTFIIGQVKK